MACSLAFTISAQTKDTTDYIKVTETGISYEIIDWQTHVEYNPYTFTWFAWEKPLVETTAARFERMIPVAKFDRPPLFDAACLTARSNKQKLGCSNEQMQQFIERRSVDYPEAARKLGQEGMEYVTFTLKADGTLADNFKVVSKNKPCIGCASAAVEIVASMEDKWYPAILNGEPVTTELTVPVRFKLIDR
ncbi:MAG: energy transducer TonB [Saprospiraceae bacterium]|nr:energy transducer TonB [Saprospiraceae bacterium]